MQSNNPAANTNAAIAKQAKQNKKNPQEKRKQLRMANGDSHSFETETIYLIHG